MQYNSTIGRQWITDLNRQGTKTEYAMNAPNRRRGGILVIVLIALLMLLGGYFFFDSMIKSARRQGQQDISQGGGKVLRKFVEGDMEGMSQTMAEEGRQKELAQAVSENRVEDVELLLQFELDLDRQNSSGATLLHRAVANDSLPIARLLVKHKAAVNIADLNGSLPIHVALSKQPSNPKMVQLLLTEDPFGINTPDRNGMTLLHLAVQNGSTDCVQILIDSGADINLKNRAKQTALVLAQANKNTKIADMLTAAGAKK